MKRLTKEQVLFLHKDLMEMVLGVASGQIFLKKWCNGSLSIRKHKG